jgi:hypothetical protein
LLAAPVERHSNGRLFEGGKIVSKKIRMCQSASGEAAPIAPFFVIFN